MCGIAGTVSTETPVDTETLLSMRDTLQHRGPDDSGLWISSDKRVGLAHRRLAIIDLSPGGHQPMADASGDIHLTFNGEIYNFIELREQLARLGHTFRTASDTEVVIEAYRHWGRDFLSHLNGMFALALFDSVEQTLICARDRAGEKPFYYRHDQGSFNFASELKALLADERSPREVDPFALEEYLSYGFVSAGNCILTGFRKLRPGCALAYDLRSGRLTEWTYWDLPSSPLHDHQSEEDLTDQLEGLLATAVAAQLVADVPVGVLLSGGIDSSLVAAMAVRAQPKIRTFTITFPEYPEYDEGRFARTVAEYFGTQHTELVAEAASVELLPLLARQYDEPVADSSIVPTYLVSRLIRQHAKVALGGDGGDELFGGYQHYSDGQRWLNGRHLLPTARHAMAHAIGRVVPVGVAGRNFAMSAVGDFEFNIAQPKVLFDRWTRARLVPHSPARRQPPPEKARAAVCQRGSNLRRLMETDFRTTMADLYLVKVDRATMLNSLEVRSPWLDHRLIEFAYGIVPDRLKATRHQRKVLSRVLSKRILPPSLDLHRKQGFSIPLSAWFRKGWGTYMKEVLLHGDGRVFDTTYVRTLVRGQDRGRSNTARLFALTMFELWCREYRVTIPW